ncbi:hypothetical protein [Micromonospora sp. KLBMP9576]|uniref:hypothetical protein n=1 Tax=Micromonospora sp. KLBMP9576 TaxID=3424769 RepID=UPI003D8B17BA
MRGGLDETLARMARREEALRRRATEAGAEDGRHAAPSGPPEGPGTDRADSRGEGRNAGPGWADTRRGAEPRDPVAEITDAVRRVVAGHPGTTVDVRIEHGGQAYPLRVAWTDTGVTVHAPAAAAPPPVRPASTRPTPPLPPGQDGPGSAARLAALIRRDPSLLSDGAPHREARKTPGSGAA